MPSASRGELPSQEAMERIYEAHRLGVYGGGARMPEGERKKVYGDRPPSVEEVMKQRYFMVFLEGGMGYAAALRAPEPGGPGDLLFPSIKVVVPKEGFLSRPSIQIVPIMLGRDRMWRPCEAEGFWRNYEKARRMIDERAYKLMREGWGDA